MYQKVKEIARSVKQSGGRALIVGGYVRDKLIGKPCKDIDVECYNIEPELLKIILSEHGNVDCVGESFKVYKVSWSAYGKRFEIDVSIPRVDKKVGEGHRGFMVEGNPNASFEEAARRRDFTINAIMFDPLTEEHIDPFNGINDINNKIIKAVDPNYFIEDSLRVLRAMSFSARFNFRVDENTIELCRRIELSDLPKERIWEEFEKMLLKSEKPWKGIIEADVLGIVDNIFPQLKPMIKNRDKSYPFFNPMDGVVHFCKDYSNEERLVILMSCLCAYINEEDFESFLDSVGVICAGSKVKDSIVRLVKDFDTPFKFRYAEVESPEGYRCANEGDFRRLSQRVNPRLLTICASMVEEDTAKWFINKMEKYDVADGPPKPILSGKHLIEMGMAPGKRMGTLIKSVYELQLDGFINNLEQAKQVAKISFNKSTEEVSGIQETE
jgi:tRNA nucleotidyltransferase (CCA-adding enzyme)